MTTLWTIGHSTRPIEDFVAALESFEVRTVADIRRYPTSRRNPQYETDALKRSLHRAGVSYEYLGDELGGWRKSLPGSPNVGLRNESFRGYADWMRGRDFGAGVDRLLALASERRAAYMCAERPPSGCHRHLLGDYLFLVRGVEVVDIYDPGHCKPHFLTPIARRDAQDVVYGAPSGEAPLESFE